ncbi:hypothetical protein [Leptolyngbya sp. Heron Island J]|nr:hypothetical protein [Leptolyngbya sp. Heron Island J]
MKEIHAAADAGDNPKVPDLLKTTRFTHVEIEQLPHDVMNDYYIARK